MCANFLYSAILRAGRSIAIPAGRASSSRRFCDVPNIRAVRLRASGEYAGIVLMPSCFVACPACVGSFLSTFPPACGVFPWWEARSTKSEQNKPLRLIVSERRRCLSTWRENSGLHRN